MLADGHRVPTRVGGGPNRPSRALTGLSAVEDSVDHDTEPPTGTYPDEPRLALLTATEVREAIEHLQLLERLDSARGQAAGRLAADLARRLPTP